MYSPFTFDERLEGNDAFQSKSQSEMFEFVISHLSASDFLTVDKPKSFSDEDLFIVYENNHGDDEYKLSREEFYSGLTSCNIGTVLDVLVPQQKLKYWAEIDESSEDEFCSQYKEIWADMLKSAGIKTVGETKSIMDDGIILVHFSVGEKQYTYRYPLPDYEFDESMFLDFDLLCEKLGVDAVFLIDEFIGDEMVGGYVLPKGAATEFSRYLPVG